MGNPHGEYEAHGASHPGKRNPIRDSRSFPAHNGPPPGAFRYPVVVVVFPRTQGPTICDNCEGTTRLFSPLRKASHPGAQAPKLPRPLGALDAGTPPQSTRTPQIPQSPRNLLIAGISLRICA